MIGAGGQSRAEGLASCRLCGKAAARGRVGKRPPEAALSNTSTQGSAPGSAPAALARTRHQQGGLAGGGQPPPDVGGRTGGAPRTLPHAGPRRHLHFAHSRWQEIQRRAAGAAQACWHAALGGVGLPLVKGLGGCWMRRQLAGGGGRTPIQRRACAQPSVHGRSGRWRRRAAAGVAPAGAARHPGRRRWLVVTHAARSVCCCFSGLLFRQRRSAGGLAGGRRAPVSLPSLVDGGRLRSSSRCGVRLAPSLGRSVARCETVGGASDKPRALKSGEVPEGRSVTHGALCPFHAAREVYQLANVSSSGRALASPSLVACMAPPHHCIACTTASPSPLHSPSRSSCTQGTTSPPRALPSLLAARQLLVRVGPGLPGA